MYTGFNSNTSVMSYGLSVHNGTACNFGRGSVRLPFIACIIINFASGSNSDN